MLKKVRPEEFETAFLERLHEECVEQMTGDPGLTDEEKRELLTAPYVKIDVCCSPGLKPQVFAT